MRMIGTSRTGLVHLLLVQSFAYALPAYLAGLIVAQIALSIARLVLLNLSGIPIDPWLTLNAFLLASLLGILIPALSSLLPIRHALSQNLHDALDLKRKGVKAVSVGIERSEDGSFSWSVVLVGAFMASFGIPLLSVLFYVLSYV